MLTSMSERMLRTVSGARLTAFPQDRLSISFRRSGDRRLLLALRALDARIDGATYRTIAEGLFGAKYIPERAWKTHDLRNRTIRLVKTGLELMHGGYRELLRLARRKK